MLNHYCSSVNKHQQAAKTKAALNLTMKANVTYPVSPQTEPQAATLKGAPVLTSTCLQVNSTGNPTANSN